MTPFHFDQGQICMQVGEHFYRFYRFTQRKSTKVLFIVASFAG